MKEIHAYACDGDVEKLRVEIEVKGVEVNCRMNNDNETPLHYAAANAQPEAVKFLLDKGADIYAKNEFLNTPLFMAVGRACMPKNARKLSNYYEVFRLLLKKEAELRKSNPSKYNGETLLQIADRNEFTPVTCLDRYPEIQKQLLKISEQIEQEQKEIATQEELARNAQPPAHLMQPKHSFQQSGVRQRRFASEEEHSDSSAHSSVSPNTENSVRKELSPRSLWNSVMSLFYSAESKEEEQQLIDRKKPPTHSPTNTRVKVQ